LALGFKRGGLNFEIFSISIIGGVWYCGDCYDCNLKKIVLLKVFLVVIDLEKYMF